MKNSEVKKIVEDLVIALGFDAELILAERNGAIHINIQLADPMLLIGRHGETLEALQHTTKIMAQKKAEELLPPIIIDVNNYKEQRLVSIEKRTREIAHKVRKSGEEYTFPPMNSFERRTVHMIVSNIADIESESLGFGKDRRVKIIRKK